MVAGTVIAEIVVLIVYLLAGTTQYDPDHSVFVIAGVCVAMGLGVLSLLLPWKPFLYGQYLFLLMALLGFFAANANLYGSLFMALDGAVIPTAFFVIAILLLAATAVSLAAAILMKSKEVTGHE